jgi:hypothetical protein
MTLRTMAALTATLLCSATAQAGTAEVLIAAINRCSGMTDATARHTCYDQLPAVVNGLSGGSPVTAAPASALPPLAAAPAAAAPATTPLAATPQTATPPVAAAAPPPPKEETATALWGAFDSEPVPPDHIEAIVESFTSDYGVFVVTLDNGQVWRQVTATSDIVRLSREHENHVAIWRDSFGNYVLKVKGFLTKYHVRRLK